MNSCCLLVLSLYPDLFDPFRRMIDDLQPDTYKILVRSGTDIKTPSDYHWLTIQGQEPFNFSRNVNRGFGATIKDDILLCGDDVKIYTPGFIEIMAEIAYSDDKIGIVTPNLGQSPFVCGYIKRSVWNSVGALDENFDGYGYEDNDWCRRMEAAGLRTQTTDSVIAEHAGGTSFYRREHLGGPCVELENARVRNLFHKKWGNQ